MRIFFTVLYGVSHVYSDLGRALEAWKNSQNAAEQQQFYCTIASVKVERKRRKSVSLTLPSILRALHSVQVPYPKPILRHEART